MSERCPYCLGALRGESERPEPLVSCADCLTRHHHACFRELGRCTTYGCEGRDTTTDLVSERRPGWELHPFLPRSEPVEVRPAFFLSVQRQEDPAVQRRRSGLRLHVPTQAHCGRVLEGELEAYVRRAVHGRALRIEARAVVATSQPGRDAEVEVYHQEAVILGQPRAHWLERFRPRREEVLLHGGLTRFALKFEPGRLHWRGRLPHQLLGYWHTLELRVHLDSRALPLSTRPHRVVVTHPHQLCGSWGAT